MSREKDGFLSTRLTRRTLLGGSQIVAGGLALPGCSILRPTPISRPSPTPESKPGNLPSNLMTAQEVERIALLIKRFEDLRAIVGEFVNPDFQGQLVSHPQDMDIGLLSALVLNKAADPNKETWYLNSLTEATEWFEVETIYNDSENFTDPKKARLSQARINAWIKLGAIPEMSPYIDGREGVYMIPDEQLEPLALRFYNVADKGLTWIPTTAGDPFGRQKPRIPAKKAVGEHPFGNGRIIELNIRATGFSNLTVTEPFDVDPSKIKG